MNIKKIAKLANVSTTTVSRVLNNREDVSQKTRKKIIDIMKQNDYVPNMAARNLSNKTSTYVGVIVSDIQNSFFSDMISGIAQTLEKENLNMLLFDTNENVLNQHKYIDMLYEQKVKGLIITPVEERDEKSIALLHRLENSGIPVVFVDRDIKDSGFDGVFVDSVKGALDATNTLIKNGHKDIAVITGPETSRPSRERYTGFAQAMQENGLAINHDYVKHGNFKSDDGYSLTKELFKLKNPPTAIFSFNNMMTLGCLRFFTEKNIIVGEEISLIGFDEIEMLDWLNINISAVSRPTTVMGIEATELLLDRIQTQTMSTGFEKVLAVELALKGSEKSIQI